ncbi:copper chaperone PCu(A)C [Parvularcula flava]|uniref:Copper chaperone PCu(A)C n=1 Tax=Aquisalinus luteolus TaxID=1566827 RepID=A0A8J3EP36_9PROT|nr:copper chaperone PCu(A)C [Aquisalinus luteolus]NHK26992.1 copper chaperone PCu(A)C [Aquisalinus luteolus]GGH94037.1 hypothetical protein GCM10011355_07280 [Aquisalinus luteolus]
MALMNTPALAGFAAILLTLAACSGQDTPEPHEMETVAAGTVAISGGWVRAVGEGVRMSAGYGTISNTGNEPDRIVALTSPVAEAVELHESVEEDGRSMMRPVTGLEVPAGGEVTLAPGGYHIMLIGVAAPLVEGETYDITITFENAGELTVPMMAMSGKNAMGHDGH